MTGPLEGTRVVDVSGYVAGPTCGAILASMGADVVKVEPPAGDEFRRAGPFVEGTSYPYEMLNHNKRSILVDLKHPDGLAVVRRLAEDADVFLESWRPGTASRLGLGYDELSAANERLVYCSISGFGQTGPYRERGGVDIIAQAMGGLMGLTGEPDRPPVKVSYPITDIGASLWGVIGTLAALSARSQTGLGQQVDVALLDSPVSWSFWEAAQYFGAGAVPGPIGSSHRNVVPYRAFLCADERYLVIGVASQQLWQRLCEVLGRQQLLDDERFASADLRRQNRTVLEDILEGVFAQAPREEWLGRLQATGIPAGPVYRYDEVLADEQVQHRGLVTPVEHPVAGPMNLVDVPLFLSGTPKHPIRSAPLPGADTDEILRAAGLDDAAIERLERSGAVHRGVAGPTAPAQ
jgi:crotonobetainyl-CoA:carnitine CoA-transferase CaiB-like acyl-CoA transferase